MLPYTACDRRDQRELVEHVVAADVARVQDQLDARERA